MSGQIIEGEALRGLLPHSGSMCLLERIDSWTDIDIQCSTLTHRDPHHPLRYDDRLSAIHLVEYAAQAAALHGALLAEGQPQPGLLAAVRDARLYCARMDRFEQPLLVHATRRLAQSDGLLYGYEIRCATELLSTGRLAIALQAPHQGRSSD